MMAIKEPKIYVFTGSGKGKTTAALGMALQTALIERRAVIVQFLKGGGYTGELYAAAWLAPYLEIKQFGYGCPIGEEIRTGRLKCTKCGLCFRENRNPVHQFAPQALAFAARIIAGGQADLLVLDEVSHAIKHNLIRAEAVLELVRQRPPHMTLVFTGRSMPETLREIADCVTECYPVKHPLPLQGIDARHGIEY
ncbi:atp:cob(i)alamin adenosyltransferase coba/cobo/butr [Lucifera butyrica]|uniref:Atp:cob(I)alamin adenosyltransferase coba/cobo/butr n=1 Tax=Lucifera butyrica TaxID=1351585 RepID=A0A498R5V4_9FIRM|nr:cob(I)yrinic acid a,c-diamide adenosyltransferase [Lucifera butyrica]VBB06834.1 atp:cob(i)alamin adenosyltransferase coba/cobo/butr [Lucifera butyrica]